LVILNEILDFSKIEAGKLTIEHIAFDLSQLVTDVLASMEGRTAPKGLTLTRLLPSDLPSQVLGDPGRIRQILTNLCDNAIKFTQQGGLTVQVAINSQTSTGCEVQLSVRDTGLGVAPAKQQLIFAAFSQADSSTTRHYGGTGLGLTICARLVEMMGGRIWVDSALGQGSTFHFTVQLECPASISIKPDATAPTPLHAMPLNTTAAAAPPPQRPLQVLLAEDHPVNQLLATTLLKKWNHTAVLAKNGQEAVDLYPTQVWDVVLMDMQMPPKAYAR
jgi:CheY-like chemotaxis protein